MKKDDVVLHEVFGVGVVQYVQSRDNLSALITVKFKDGSERRFQETSEKLTIPKPSTDTK